MLSVDDVVTQLVPLTSIDDVVELAKYMVILLNINEEKKPKRPKVGLVTGWKEEIENKDKEELNVDFIIRKPFDLSEITRNINDVFGVDSR